jgi:hypothetical protein
MLKKILLASACVFALGSQAAFAQTNQPCNGASTQGNVGPGACDGTVRDRTVIQQGTVGASSSPSPGRDASTSGAASGAPVNNTGAATQPGAVRDGVNRR